MDKETIEQLNEELSEDEIKSRSTDWGTVEYLSASNVINKANKIFDYEWNGEIINLELVRKEQITRTYTKNGKKVKKEMWDVSYTCVYQVSVGDRTHQDVGFGNSMQENLSSSLETAIKSAVSDGIKRALRAWGDQFGLRLYEHDINESTSSQDNTSSDNEFEIPDNVTKDTIRESIKFAYNRPWVDQENPESITDKQRGKIKGFLSNINLSDEEQHKFLQKITGRSIDSTTDMYKYEANGFLHLLFNANDKLKSIFNNNNNSSNDEDKNEMDYIVELSEKLDEHDIKKQALLDWLNEKADTEIDTLDDIPKAWLERMIGDGFWNKNKDDIMRSDKEKLVKRVKDKLDDKDIEYEAQLYKWYSEQEDEDYEKLSDLETGQLKQVLEEEFWEENYKEIDEVVPF